MILIVILATVAANQITDRPQSRIALEVVATVAISLTQRQDYLLAALRYDSRTLSRRASKLDVEVVFTVRFEQEGCTLLKVVAALAGQEVGK